MTECPICGTALEKPKAGWIEKLGPGDIFLGKLTKWDQTRWRGGIGIFGWVDEWRLSQLKGEYCPKGHLGIREVETAKPAKNASDSP